MQFTYEVFCLYLLGLSARCRKRPSFGGSLAHRVFIIYLGLPTPKKYQSFCTIRRFIKFMVVSKRFPKKLGVVCHGCVSHRHGPVFSPVCCSQNMEPHIQVGFCLIARSQNYTILPDFLDLRAFAGFWRAFCGFLRAFCG